MIFNAILMQKKWKLFYLIIRNIMNLLIISSHEQIKQVRYWFHEYEMFCTFQLRVAFDIHSIRMSWLVFEVQLLMHINNEHFMDYERIIFVKWNFMLCLFFHIFAFLLFNNRLIIDKFVFRLLFEACSGKWRMEIISSKNIKSFR